VEYLITTDNIAVLLFHSNLTNNQSLALIQFITIFGTFKVEILSHI